MIFDNEQKMLEETERLTGHKFPRDKDGSVAWDEFTDGHPQAVCELCGAVSKCVFCTETSKEMAEYMGCCEGPRKEEPPVEWPASRLNCLQYVRWKRKQLKRMLEEMAWNENRRKSLEHDLRVLDALEKAVGIAYGEKK